MVYGILVVYSEDYFIESLIEFNKILKLTMRKYKLVVVFNDNKLANNITRFPIQGIEFEIVLGSNQYHEFSGWNEGLCFISNKYATDYEDAGYVFCNDTLCHHRTYAFIHRIIFSVCCNLALVSNKPAVAGELTPPISFFEFNNVKFNSWIATYFFVINKQAMRFMKNKLLPNKEIIDKYLLGGDNQNSFFSGVMHENLKNQLLYWLFKGGWHKSEALNKNNKDFFYNKARSIITEITFSSEIYAQKIKFINTYYLIRLYSKAIPEILRSKIRSSIN